MTILSRKEIAEIKSASVAKATLAQYADLLRTTLEIQEKLEKRVEDLSGLVEVEKQAALFTKQQIEEMRRRMYADSSERRADDDPGPLFEAAAGAESEEPVAAAAAPGEQKKKARTKFGRTPQPQLPRLEVEIELSEEEMKAQGLKKWEGQFETSEVITVIPTRIIIEEQKRQKYLATDERDPTLPPIVTAPAPVKTKEGSRYSLEFDIEVALAKYLWHLPLDRQVRMMASQGLVIESQTLYARIDTLAWYLETALMPRLVAEVHSDPVKLGDETTWKNLAAKPEGGGKNKRFYLWAVRGGRAVCFSVFDGRSGKVAKTFLGGIEGVLVVDGFRGYDGLAGPKLIIARDWVHARRKFIAAEKSHPKESAWFIGQMKLLFEIEEELKGKPLEEIRKARKARSLPIIDRIEARRDELSDKTLPGSALGKAVAYLGSYWQGLTVFLEHPEVPIHTNTIEGVLRGPVVGRKNHYGSKNLKSGNVAAIFYSIIETCKANDVDARRYLYQAMMAILTKKPVPMPWDLKQARGAADPPGLVSETVVSGTGPGLRTGPPEDGASAVSEPVA